MTTKDKLVHAVTEYDRKQSTKRGYNPHALGIYFERIDEICEDVERGAPLRLAIVRGLTGRLCDACLKAVGEPISTQGEYEQSGWAYEPVIKKG